MYTIIKKSIIFALILSVLAPKEAYATPVALHMKTELRKYRVAVASFLGVALVAGVAVRYVRTIRQSNALKALQQKNAQRAAHEAQLEQETQKTAAKKLAEETKVKLEKQNEAYAQAQKEKIAQDAKTTADNQEAERVRVTAENAAKEQARQAKRASDNQEIERARVVAEMAAKKAALELAELTESAKKLGVYLQGHSPLPALVITPTITVGKIKEYLKAKTVCIGRTFRLGTLTLGEDYDHMPIQSLMIKHKIFTLTLV